MTQLTHVFAASYSRVVTLNELIYYPSPSHGHDILFHVSCRPIFAQSASSSRAANMLIYANYIQTGL